MTHHNGAAQSKSAYIRFCFASFRLFHFISSICCLLRCSSHNWCVFDAVLGGRHYTATFVLRALSIEHSWLKHMHNNHTHTHTQNTIQKCSIQQQHTEPLKWHNVDRLVSYRRHDDKKAEQITKLSQTNWFMNTVSIFKPWHSLCLPLRKPAKNKHSQIFFVNCMHLRRRTNTSCVLLGIFSLSLFRLFPINIAADVAKNGDAFVCVWWFCCYSLKMVSMDADYIATSLTIIHNFAELHSVHIFHSLYNTLVL